MANFKKYNKGLSGYNKIKIITTYNTILQWSTPQAPIPPGMSTSYNAETTHTIQVSQQISADDCKNITHQSKERGTPAPDNR